MYPILDAKLGKEIQLNLNYENYSALDVSELANDHVEKFPNKPLVQTTCEFVNYYMRQIKGPAAAGAQDNCSLLAFNMSGEKLIVVLALSHGMTDVIVNITLLKQLIQLMVDQ